MMKAVVVAEETFVSKQLTEQLNVLLGEKVSFVEVSLQGDLIGNIKKLNPEILLTINLAGFDRSTLTDNIAYNLLDCKQLHVISEDELRNEMELEKLLSIAMFFACSKREMCEVLKVKYPHIPWLACMEGWNHAESLCAGENVAEIARILELVIKECRLG